MILSKLEKLVRKLPLAGDFYLAHYCRARRALFKFNRYVPLMKFPRYVHFMVTYDCNLNCQQCQVSAGQRKVNQLSTAEAIGVIDQIRAAGVNHLIFTGGEPLLRKDIFDLLEHARKVGIPFITLATNGYLAEKFKDALREVHVDKVVTSIDGVGAWNDRFRGKNGAFEKSLRALDVFKALGVEDREVNTTVMPGQVGQMKRLADHIAASSATRWVLGIVIPVGRAAALSEIYYEDKELLELLALIKEIRAYAPAELMSHTGYLGKEFEDFTSEPFCCRAGWEVCSITPDGEVVPCNMVSEGRFSEGNLREKDFKTIWDQGFRELRNPKVPDPCRDCEHLTACDGGCWAYRALDAPYCYKSIC